MSQEIGKLHYDLDINDSKLDKQLKGASNKIKSFGKVIAVAGAALTAIGIGAVKAFQESEDAIAQTNAVLKSTKGIAGVTAKQVEKLSSSLQLVTKFSDETIRSGENLLLTFTNIGKDVFPQATETMLDMSQALGQDVKASAIQLGKALQDPILGVTALRRVGVNFNSAQQETIKKLVESGQHLKAQKLILKELQTEFGGAAKAAGETFSGKLAILGNKLGEIQETIGKVIVEAVTPLVDEFTKFLEGIDWQPILADIRSGLAGLGVVLGLVLNVIKALLPVVGALGNWIKNNTGVVMGMVAAFGALWTIMKTRAAVNIFIKNMGLASLAGKTNIGKIRLVLSGLQLALAGFTGWGIFAGAAAIALGAIIGGLFDTQRVLANTQAAIAGAKASNAAALSRLDQQKKSTNKAVRDRANANYDAIVQGTQILQPKTYGIKVDTSLLTKGIPHAMGVRNFKGGLSKLHEGELVNLPRGTDVYTKREAENMRGNVFTGNIYLGDRSAVREFFDRLNRNSKLESMGGSPINY